MVRIPRPHPSAKPGVKVDARSERWREHRKKVRNEIVDAAFRAIDRLGPELSVRQIAEEAGTAKPKIYRHFTDKSDLLEAIGMRLRDMLWAAIFPSLDLATDSAREVIRRSVEEYVNLVDQHPNVLRVVHSGPLGKAVRGDGTHPQRRPGDHAGHGRDVQQRAARDGAESSRARTRRIRAFGSAASATEWWLGPEPDSPRRMPREQFVAHLTTIMMGVIVGTAEALGIAVDPDQPIHDAVPNNPAVR